MSRLTRPLLFASSEECEHAFYEALDNGDAAALADLWLEDDDVVCIHPGGPRITGIGAVRASWNSILANGPVQVRSSSRKSLDTPTVAMHNVIEELVVGRGSEQQVVRVIATNAYVKTASGWKMVLHHASPVPQGTPPSFEDAHGVLH
jgi:ketosteroid isomerase-like protein